MKAMAVIPARYGSSRMPGKPIADILGKPMIWWIYAQAVKCKWISSCVVAADDERIRERCREFGIPVIMTSASHDTPTSRLCEVASRTESDMYLLLMGDEPLIDVRCFDYIIPREPVPEYYVAALTNILESPAEVIDFSNQKVVCNPDRNAMLISRSPIPYPKGTLDFRYEKVTGVQLFSRKSLDFFERTEKSIIEKAEENDLLRFMENGIPVRMIVSPFKTISVDTPKDLGLVRNILNSGGK